MAARLLWNAEGLVRSAASLLDAHEGSSKSGSHKAKDGEPRQQNKSVRRRSKQGATKKQKEKN
eukprot:5722979-Karenia_brevis.AAC.1